MEEETFLMERYKLAMIRVREIPEEIGKRTTKGFGCFNIIHGQVNG